MCPFIYLGKEESSIGIEDIKIKGIKFIKKQRRRIKNLNYKNSYVKVYL